MVLTPIRELLAQHREDVTGRLDRIDGKLDRLDSKLDDHTHMGKVSWAALVPLMLALAALIVGLS